MLSGRKNILYFLILFCWRCTPEATSVSHIVIFSQHWSCMQLPLSFYLGVISYHSQQLPLLLESGTAAQHACYHDNGSSQDQYVGGGSVGLGGEEAYVVALFHQGPNTHCHHNASCQLGEKGTGWIQVSFSGQSVKAKQLRFWSRKQ